MITMAKKRRDPDQINIGVPYLNLDGVHEDLEVPEFLPPPRPNGNPYRSIPPGEDYDKEARAKRLEEHAERIKRESKKVDYRGNRIE